MKRDLYAEVSARIVAELEAGAAPWVKPWSATPGANTPCNAVSNRPYSGCNVVLLWMAQAAVIARRAFSHSSRLWIWAATCARHEGVFREATPSPRERRGR
jgi:antirestriction protein ArdC